MTSTCVAFFLSFLFNVDNMATVEPLNITSILHLHLASLKTDFLQAWLLLHIYTHTYSLTFET